MPIFNNDQELQAFMEKTVRDVLENIKKKLLDDFKEEYIEKYVYHGHTPNTVYEPTKEFKDAWEFTEIEKQANTLMTKLWYNWESMPTNEPDYYISSSSGFGIGIHGSYVEGWDSDERPYLMETLDKEGYSSSLRLQSGRLLSVNRAVAYWQKFLEDYFSGGKMLKLFDEEFSKVGITRS